MCCVLREYLAASVIVLMLSGGEALEAYAVKKAGYDLQVLIQQLCAREFCLYWLCWCVCRYCNVL